MYLEFMSVQNMEHLETTHKQSASSVSFKLLKMFGLLAMLVFDKEWDRLKTVF